MKIVYLFFLTFTILNAESLDRALQYYAIKNYSKTVELLNIGCKDNISDACAMLGSMYDKGEGVRRSREKATKFYVKSCKLRSSGGCFNLGRLYYKYNLKKKASDLYAISCQLNHKKGCNSLGIMYEKGDVIRKDKKIAKQLYKKACALGHSKACGYYEEMDSWMYNAIY